MASGKYASRALATAACIGLAGSGIVPVHAQAPAGLQDLVGVSGSSGESALQARGYEHVSTTEGTASKQAFYWNKSDKQCVRVTTYDGRYSAIDAVAKKDCGKNDDGTAIAVAVGVAALIGAIAIASSKKKDKDYYPSGASEHLPYDLQDLPGMKASTGERVLRDRGYSYRSGGSGNYSRWAYWSNRRMDQCVAVTTRDGRYDDIVIVPDNYCGNYGRPGYGNDPGNSYRPNYGADARFKDLKGDRASSADSDLRQRGFRNVDGFKSGNTSYTVWYRQFSNQCVQMTVANGKVADIRDIRTHPKCR